MKVEALKNPLVSFELKRDAYGFAVRPQHLQRYREYANIYKEEEEERSERWKDFLERRAESAQLPLNGLWAEHAGDNEEETDASLENGDEEDDYGGKNPGSKTHKVQIWTPIRPSLHAIEKMMSNRVKRSNLSKSYPDNGPGKPFTPIEEARSPKGASEEESEEEFYDVERSDLVQDVPSSDNVSSTAMSNAGDVESLFPWKEELECLVRGGVPMALRGELWQAFVGARARRVESYYQDLLAPETKSGKNMEQHGLQTDDNSKGLSADSACIAEKWKGQIEKVILLWMRMVEML